MMKLFTKQSKTFLFLCFLIGASGYAQQKKVHNTIKIEESDSKEVIIEKASRVVPTQNQWEALSNEYIAFVHLGPNTFTRMEWGNGKEDPKIFDLKTLDTDQWCKAMHDSGMKMVILTVKHHDGFVLWQSRYTNHGVMSTDFRGGKGDILKDLSESCQKYGLKLGVYLSPADLYQIEHPEGLYGNLSKYTKRTIPREVPGRPFANKTTFEFEVDDYNEYFLNQLFEILTEYGPVHEVWFDGAHPKTKGGQQYNYTAWKQLIRTLAPKAVIFGREDIRWGGNESGATRETEWNVIPMPMNPATAQRFPDMTGKDLGSREKLYNAKYLHYQQAEINTSIREGWFYRDDTFQKVRSADDVFDIYERTVGGNTTFLLNIPPNREGKFPQTDVDVLKEVGQRIRETYDNNLLYRAKGCKKVLDNNPDTYLTLDKKNQEIIISSKKPITFNRIVLQEAIRTHGERVEKHSVEAWINNQWQEIASATNIGYKRILRFPEVTTSKIRFRVLQSRNTPAISHISAHYYKTRPPQLSFFRNLDGMVTIAPMQTQFNWKPHGQNASENLNTGYEIFYTLDGSEPNENSAKYTEPFFVENKQLKAVSFNKGMKGAVRSEDLGILKKQWKVLNFSSEQNDRKTTMAFDAQPNTYWQSQKSSEKPFIAIDLGKIQTLKALVYTPQTFHSKGMLAKGLIQVSNDGKTWQTVANFEFGNLINDPTPRTFYFLESVTSRYVRIEATEIAENGDILTIAELDFL
ncbi:alpha-L-fucosidase [Capnocytophaga canimorsus]|uniref:alpha-L-fucosidase n=1 Tax=Capnocytophaga canimorsus TaxID=28188 RepID=UPI0037D5B97D